MRSVGGHRQRRPGVLRQVVRRSCQRHIQLPARRELVLARLLQLCFWIADLSSTVATPFTQSIAFWPPTATITATISPAVPRPGEHTTVTVTGASEAPLQAFAEVRRDGGAPSSATYATDTGASLLERHLVDGAFSIGASMTQQSPGPYLLCLWLAESSTDPAPAAGPQPQPFAVVAPPPAPRPYVVPSHVKHASLSAVRKRLVPRGTGPSSAQPQRPVVGA